MPIIRPPSLSSSQKNIVSNAIASRTNDNPYVTLANLAREKYEHFKHLGKPLEDKHIGLVKKQDKKFMEDAAQASGRNAAIQRLSRDKPKGNNIIDLNNHYRTVAPATTSGAISGVNTQRNRAADMKLKTVNLGRNIQSNASGLMKRSLAMESGNIAAENAARSANSALQDQMIGTLAGYGAGAYARKKNWI